MDITVNNEMQYLERCINIDYKVEVSDVIEKTILGDVFSVLPFYLKILWIY